MWGAQARAAEYKAFQAAAARRASEEQKLPQKPAPVSLGAFTKNAPTNRNKGVKAWKPLVLEDTPETDNDTRENDTGKSSTPTRLKPTGRGSSISEGIDISRLVRNPQAGPSNSSTPRSTVPKAPRAMIDTSQTPSTLINPTPTRVQPHLLVKQGHQATTRSVHSSPGSYAGTGGYPNPIQYPHVTYWYNLQGVPTIVPQPMSAMSMAQPLTIGNPGSVMVPNDISPTKQENKFASMSHHFAGPSVGHFTPHGHFTPAAGSFANELLPPTATSQFAKTAGGGFYQGRIIFPNPAPRPVRQQASSDNVIEMDGSYSDASSFGIPPIVRPYSYPQSATTHMPQPVGTDPMASATPPKPVIVPLTSEEGDKPYDRKTKVESFVATQQALARTGKTVLHNPDLHRVKASEGVSPASSGSGLTTPDHGSYNQVLTPGSVSVLKLPPGFGVPGLSRQTSEAENDEKASSIDQATLQQIFETENEEWLELRPVTENDRKKMRRIMKTFARAQAPDAIREFTQETNGRRKEELTQWMHDANKDCKPITATRKMFEEAAKERLLSGPNALDGFSLSAAEVECATICAVGDIVASLVENGSSASGTANEGLFWRYKPAPEYAIERGRLLLVNTGNTSFFEDDTGGFYTAPSRIARDPRFRPAGKEAIPVKADENWKMRADMYGRRRV